MKGPTPKPRKNFSGLKQKGKTKWESVFSGIRGAGSKVRERLALVRRLRRNRLKGASRLIRNLNADELGKIGRAVLSRSSSLPLSSSGGTERLADIGYREVLRDFSRQRKRRAREINRSRGKGKNSPYKLTGLGLKKKEKK